MTEVIDIDEQLPPVNETIIFVVVEEVVDNTNSKLKIYHDFGVRTEYNDFLTYTNWDETLSGRYHWKIVGWMPVPKRPSEEEVRKHWINWDNRPYEY